MRFRTTIYVVGVLTASVCVQAQPQTDVKVDPHGEMLETANAFLETLESAQNEKATLPFGDELRTKWHFFPMDRKGLPLRDLNEKQKETALALLQAGLSSKGFEKAQGVRTLEGVLRKLENATGDSRNPELYYFLFFGKPSKKETWGFRYEGHHLSLNWTMKDGKIIASAPRFFGANPSPVPSGERQGLRILPREEDLGRALLNALTSEQRKIAIVSDTAPPDILTGAEPKVSRLADEGISFDKLNADQQKIMKLLIREYARTVANAQARARLRKIRSDGWGQLKFAWMGGTEPGQGQYYRIQGKDFLLEYDNTQGDATHVHTVWRDIENDFGRDMLALHYQQYPHGVKTATAKKETGRYVKNPLLISLLGH